MFLHLQILFVFTPLYDVPFDTHEVDYGMFQQDDVKNTKTSNKDKPELTAGQQV